MLLISLSACNNNMQCPTGVTDRFGEDVFERLKQDGQITVHDHKPWVLTREVRHCLSRTQRLALNVLAHRWAGVRMVHPLAAMLGRQWPTPRPGTAAH